MNNRIPYIHLDIAGVMKTLSEDNCMRKGMSGKFCEKILTTDILCSSNTLTPHCLIFQVARHVPSSISLTALPVAPLVNADTLSRRITINRPTTKKESGEDINSLCKNKTEQNTYTQDDCVA